MFGLFFGGVELLAAHRLPYWHGMGQAELRSFVSGCIVYALLVILGTEALRGAVSRWLRKGPVSSLTICICATLAALGMHGVVSGPGEAAGANVGSASIVAILGLGATVAAANVFWGVSVAPVAFLWSTAFVAGFLAVIAGDNLWFFHPDRPSLVTGIALAWIGLTLLALFGAWLSNRSKVRSARIFCGAVAAACLATPALLLRVEPSLSLDATSSGPGKSLLLITADALRADYCAVYGGVAPTPALESLAYEGVIFEHAYSVAPWTVPSVVGLMASSCPFSLTPSASQERWDREVASIRVPSEAGTLAAVFAEKGYATAAFVGNPALRKETGVLEGFELAHVIAESNRERTGVFRCLPLAHKALARAAPRIARHWERPLDTSAMLTRYAVTFLRRRRSGPFMLWVHYMDPHEPYSPPRRFRTGSGPWPLFAPTDPYWGGPQLGPSMTDVPLGEGADEKVAYIRSLYADEIAYMDWCVGLLLHELSALRMRDDAYVLFTSCHGEELWERGRFNHGQSLYEEQVWVPLICTGPDLAPRIVEAPVSAIDIAPTLAELVGAEPDGQWQGQSLAPRLLGDEAPQTNRPCFIQATLFSAPEPLQAVVSGSYKLIRGLESKHIELYNLANDRNEQHNRAQKQPDLADALLAELTAWNDSCAPRPELDDVGADRPATLRQLRAIGYLGD